MRNNLLKAYAHGHIDDKTKTKLRYKFGSLYTGRKKEMKFVNVIPDYVQNFIYPLTFFLALWSINLTPKSKNIFNKSQNLLKIVSKMHFLLLVILSDSDNVQKMHSFVLHFQNYIYC